MAVIINGAVKLYYYLNEEIADHRTENWPLMRTPWPGLVIISLYLLTVLKLFPKYMENRSPFNLRKYIALYNAVQIVCCIYVFYQSMILGWLNHYKLICQPLDYGPLSIEYAWKVCYAYFIIKLMDLLDTVFFVLRKKQNQISFLHVYHHCGMVAVSWGMVKWLPGLYVKFVYDYYIIYSPIALLTFIHGLICSISDLNKNQEIKYNRCDILSGHTSIIVPLNSFVHIIMYSYYLLTTWDDKKSLWWKKHVTQIQIIQFTLLLIHFLLLVFVSECEYPRQPAYIMIPQNLFMVILFCDFYYNTYIKTSANKNK